ncbi:hypothetical protein EMCRGX_G013115 [Ephydatia muelleri]
MEPTLRNGSSPNETSTTPYLDTADGQCSASRVGRMYTDKCGDEEPLSEDGVTKGIALLFQGLQPTVHKIYGDTYKADPEKKKASVRDTYNANAVSKRAAKRQRYQEGVEENRAAKRQRYQEGVEENRAAKRQRYQEGVEENRAANRRIYRGNSATIKAARRSRYWKGRRTTTTTQRLYDTKVALRNVDLIDNRLEGTVQTLTSASSETEERLFVRWTDDGWTSINNTEASKVAPNIYSFVIERTAGSTVKMAIKYIIGEHELWDTNHFHDFTF